MALVTRPSAEPAHQVALMALGERFAGLRLAGEEPLRRMRQSLARHGQLSAIVAYTTVAGSLEIIDGFKRVRAARELGWAELRVRAVAGDAVQAKVAISILNAGHGLSELEEAWLIRSLYRDDGLSQPAIGQLLGRHKSWVCRRLVLAEGLDEAVQADVRLGLLAAKTACALARLPRGNQRAAADAVVRRGMTSAQTERLVDALLANPGEAEQILRRQPGPAAPPAPGPAQRTAGQWIIADAGAVTRLAARLQARLLDAAWLALGDLVHEALVGLDPVLVALHRRIEHLTTGTTGQEPTHVDHARRAHPPDRDAVPPGHDEAGDRPRAGHQP